MIRQLPDGGGEFVLEEPALTCIRIDHQSRLQFGATELVIGAAFTVERDGTAYRLHPRRSETLGPLAALYPATIRWLWTSRSGHLTAVFRSGPVVTVYPDPVVMAWSVGNVHCLPAGGERESTETPGTFRP